jgi:hypothetical protein
MLSAMARTATPTKSIDPIASWSIEMDDDDSTRSLQLMQQTLWGLAGLPEQVALSDVLDSRASSLPSQQLA